MRNALAELTIYGRLASTSLVIWTGSQPNIDYIRLSVVRLQKPMNERESLEVAITEPWCLEACNRYFAEKEPGLLTALLRKQLQLVLNLCGTDESSKGNDCEPTSHQSFSPQCRQALGAARGGAL